MFIFYVFPVVCYLYDYFTKIYLVKFNLEYFNGLVDEFAFFS